MVTLRLPSHRKTSDGFIIVAVLWILAALATLASIYTLYVGETSAAMGGHSDRLRAQALATAGIELGVYRLTASPEPLSHDRISFQMGGATVAVDMRSEGARIDLNGAPMELLSGLFSSLGARSDNAEYIAERVVAWRSPRPPAGGTDLEEGNYRTAGKQYGPRHGPFPHVNELALVLGMTPALIDRALPYLTVYSGSGQINVLDAAPEVLAALPGMTPDKLHALLELRSADPRETVRTLPVLLGPSARYVAIERSKATRMTIEVRFDARRRMFSEAVVLVLPGDTESYRVLSWRDDIEAPATEPRATPTLR